MTLEKIAVDGSEIQDLIFGKLVPACNGEHTGHVILALLTLSVISMKPNVDYDTLKKCVMAMSETAMLHLVEIQGEAN